MARGGRYPVRYRPHSLPRKFSYGRKIQDQYGGWTYEDRLVPDDFGTLYDPRKHDGDIDTGTPPGLRIVDSTRPLGS